MTVAALLDVIAQVQDVLAAHGHADKAAWLSEKAAVLRTDATIGDEKNAFSGEIHSIVPGMGGLLDLRLQPSATRGADDARRTLDELADQLFELTR